MTKSNCSGKKKKKGNYKFQKAKPNQTVNSSNCRASSTF